MEKIKFRIFSEVENRMIYDDLYHYCFIDKDGTLNTTQWKMEAFIMQYTGFKDMHGIEIFESDIIRIKHPYKNRKNKGIIEFLSGGFMIKDYYAPHQDNPTDFIESIEYAEVIGNIYENKDLL